MGPQNVAGRRRGHREDRTLLIDTIAVCVQRLLGAGAAVDMLNRDGHTALTWVALAGNKGQLSRQEGGTGRKRWQRRKVRSRRQEAWGRLEVVGTAGDRDGRRTVTVAGAGKVCGDGEATVKAEDEPRADWQKVKTMSRYPRLRAPRRGERGRAGGRRSQSKVEGTVLTGLRIGCHI